MQTKTERYAAIDAQLNAAGLTPEYFALRRAVAAAAKARGEVGPAVPLNPHS